MDEIRRASALLLRRLRVDLRSPGGHAVRAIASACLLLTIFAVVQSQISLGAPGLTVYRWIVWVDSLLISIGSVTVFASIIAAEREQGTLPLLRLTGTTPLSLILGQGFSGIVIGCLLLVVQIPFVVLTITLGGVLWDQVMATFLALLAHLVLCAGLGLFWSVVCSRSGSASFYTLLSIVGLWLGTWLFRLALNRLASHGWIMPVTETVLDSASVWIDQRLVWSQLNNIASSLGGTELISSQFWWSLAAGGGLLAASAWLLDRRPLETPPYSPIVIRLWSSSGNRAWSRLAIAGKDYRQFMGGVKGAVARVIVYLVVPIASGWWTATFVSRSFDLEDLTTMVFWFSASFLTIEAAAIASRVFRNELTEHTWSSLAVLPRWRPVIVVQKLIGAFLGLLPGLGIGWLAAMTSRHVQEFFLGPHYSSENDYMSKVVMMQPLLWISATGFAALMATGAPPTVTIFGSFIAIVAQWCLMLFTAMLFWGQRFTMEQFAILYLISTSVLCVLFLAGTMFRLRRLTERN